MIRVTTNGTLHNYRSHLMRSANNQQKAFTSVLTQRQFNSYAEDPAAATQAFRMRSARASAGQQIYNNKAVTGKFSTAWSIIDGIKNDIADEMGKIPALEGSSDTNLSVLKELGQVLKAGAKSIVQDMNGKYGDNFIFGGADTLNVPFKLENGVLTYRGKNVNEIGQPNGPTYDEVNDQLNVDLGLGFKEVNGQLVSSSAYDSALNGLDFLGYGKDQEGLPNNIVSVMWELGEAFEGYDLETNTWKNPGGREQAQKLVGKLEEASDAMIRAHTELSSETTYLKTNMTRLEETSDNLNTQITGLEDIDPAEAIMSLVWAQQCYNAALKVGTNIISQSLLDYMN